VQTIKASSPGNWADQLVFDQLVDVIGAK